MILEIPKSEIKERQKKFMNTLDENGLDACILFSTTDIFYLTNFMFRPSERPIAFFIDTNNESHLFVPSLEHLHAENYAVIDYVHSYPEYPGEVHPMNILKELLKANKLNNAAVGFDADGYSSPKGYSGPLISDLLSFKKTLSIKGWVEKQRYIKSDNEIQLIKESARWGNLAHNLLVEYSKAGSREMEIEGRATHEATRIMFKTLGHGYKPYGNPAHAFYRGQIGPHSTFPHSQNQNAQLERGFNVVSQAACDVWGYKSELERTMFIEEASNEQEMYFNHMYEAQEVAFRTIKPGISASEVEKEVQKYFKDNGLQHLVRHHTGHNMGLLNHEAPFFDLGDHTILEPGMVFSVEPGIYVDGLGAFRHSDTIAVTESGMEMITYYPRDFDSLII
ncbi:aminopeptidase P family protein [Salinicoccus sp. ID82-1]|uniref:M24 family metallopeptidase n=1 Tax=Salinicoccus sp. ID82-1 TaxID=2820269 RepID=UPI001F3CC2B7|nr:Xaa-Pro peptidase family protein [Salinicoccus sp. ID82-1]MCG1008472.1 aminopeptidase P family protein [Salinicoccus sp. ID82-1]